MTLNAITPGNSLKIGDQTFAANIGQLQLGGPSTSEFQSFQSNLNSAKAFFDQRIGAEAAEQLKSGLGIQWNQASPLTAAEQQRVADWYEKTYTFPENLQDKGVSANPDQLKNYDQLAKAYEEGGEAGLGKELERLGLASDPEAIAQFVAMKNERAKYDDSKKQAVEGASESKKKGGGFMGAFGSIFKIAASAVATAFGGPLAGMAVNMALDMAMKAASGEKITAGGIGQMFLGAAMSYGTGQLSGAVSSAIFDGAAGAAGNTALRETMRQGADVTGNVFA
jgi:hypothetical protein